MSANLQSVDAVSEYGLPCDFRIVRGQTEAAISDAMNCFLSSALATIEALADDLGKSVEGGTAWSAAYLIRMAGHCLVELDRLAAERAGGEA